MDNREERRLAVAIMLIITAILAYAIWLLGHDRETRVASGTSCTIVEDSGDGHYVVMCDLESYRRYGR